MKKALLLFFSALLLFLYFQFKQQPENNTETETTGNADYSRFKTVSIDDDPYKGSPSANLTLIEFSSFECSNCKLFWEETLPVLEKEYIDKGKLLFVYRDLPLEKHNPIATKESLAANCAREQGGDELYFKFHDDIFEKTTSGGNGLTEEDLTSIAKNDDLIDINNFTNCYSSGKYLDEIRKDFFDATNLGVTSTPTFFLGVSSKDGVIRGIPIVGAMTFSGFKIIIDEMLQALEEEL